MRLPDRKRVEALCGPTTIYHVISEIFPWAAFLLTVIVLAALWRRIPEQVPMHTDFTGSVTEWGGKNNLIWLCAVYFGINLLLWIIGFFPEAWNNGLRLQVLRRRVRIGGGAVNYRLTRDLLCDLRISISLLFSALLLMTAFYRPAFARHMLSWGIWVLLGVPLVRYLLRLVLRR